MLLKVKHETANDKRRAQTLGAIQATMLEVSSNAPLLLEVVAAGPHTWRSEFFKAFAGLAVDGYIADRMFAFFCQQVQLRYGQNVLAGQVLDTLQLPSKPSQREIDDAWEVESFSSEEGRRYFYGPDGHPEEIIKRLVH